MGSYTIVENGITKTIIEEAGRTKIIYGESGNSSSHSIVNMIHTAPDGSKLDKPISAAYLKNIQNRKNISESKHGIIRPGMYGSGKRLPKGM